MKDFVPKIVVIVISGVRNEEVCARRSYMPLLWNDIRPKGLLFNNLVDNNVAFHMPSTHAINTGMSYNYYHKVMKFKLPTIFQYLRFQREQPKAKVCSFGIWSERNLGSYEKLNGLGSFPSFFTPTLKMNSELINLLRPAEMKAIRNARKIEIIRYGRYLWDMVGRMQFQLCKRAIDVYRPDYIHYVLNDVECAHYDAFGRYVLSLRYCDEKIMELWQRINADPYYKGKTWFFVTPDCGRDPYYMQHFQISRIQKSWLFAYGPNLEKGGTCDARINHVDFFPTIAKLLDLNVHDSEGTLIPGFF